MEASFRRKFILPRSRDQQPFLRPGNAPSSLRYPSPRWLCRGRSPGKLVEEVHVLGGLDFRGIDLAEADEGVRHKT